MKRVPKKTADSAVAAVVDVARVAAVVLADSAGIAINSLTNFRSNGVASCGTLPLFHFWG